ncbi:MAG: STAS domain-containing protein [Spirochaetales bacterium]|nr:STAS domain-containing protein [Spirochaetales bacterium]
MSDIEKIKIDDHLTLMIEDLDIIVHMKIKGILETDNSHGFQRVAVNLVDQGKRFMLLGLEELSYTSSTGVGAFLTILRACKTHKGNAVIYDMQPRVKESFDLLGFSRFFESFHNYDLALAHLRQSEHEDIPLFPLAFACPKESHPLRINKPGYYTCPHCDVKFQVTEKGEVLALALK